MRLSDYSWNLLPWRKKQRQQQRQRGLKSLIKTIIFALLVVLLVHVILLVMLHNRDEYNSSLRRNITRLQPQANSVLNVRQQQQQLQANLEMVQNLMAQQSQPLQLLHALTPAIPDGVYLTHIIMQPPQFIIQGQAETSEQITELQNNLKRSGKFHGIKTQNSPLPDAAFPYRLAFTVQMNVEGS